MTLAPLTILIAEDDDGHATLVRRNLRRAGVDSEPVHLRDGQDLLDYLHRRAPWNQRPIHDALVIVADLNMPRLNGIDVLRALKSDSTLARIPIYILTTTDNPTEIDRCYSSGASGCIVKPVDYADFAAAVQRLGQFFLSARMPGEQPLARTHG